MPVIHCMAYTGIHQASGVHGDPPGVRRTPGSMRRKGIITRRGSCTSPVVVHCRAERGVRGSISKRSDIYTWWILVDPRTPRCTQGGFWWILYLIHWTPDAWNVFCFYLRVAGSSWILMYASRILCSGSRV